MCQKRPVEVPQQIQCVGKEQFKIKWPQIIHSVKRISTQKQIPRQNEKFNLISANKVSV